MEQGKCWCNEKEPVNILWDQNQKVVFALDGGQALLNMRISPEQEMIGLPIDFCPYCGRQLADMVTPRMGSVD